MSDEVNADAPDAPDETAILSAAIMAELPGWSPMPAGSMKGFMCKPCLGGWWIGGIAPNGRPYSKHTHMSDETTFDPVLAARELHAHACGTLAPPSEEAQGAGDDGAPIQAALGPSSLAEPGSESAQSEGSADDPAQHGSLGAGGDGASLGDAGRSAYPGITILPDTLGTRRNAVLAAITARRVLLEDVAADPSRRSFLLQAFTDYTNLSAMKAPITEQQEANYREYLALDARDMQIARAAAGIERAALDADMEGLERIAQGLEDALR